MDFLEAFKTKLTEGRNYKNAIKEGYTPLDRKQYSRYNHFRPEGAKRLFCYLPYNSLTFSFGGKVYVCSYNRDVILGEYPQNSIKEIWEGPKAVKLRRHMSHNDLEYGCRHCKFFFDKGKFSNIRPLVFDKYYKHTNADFPRVFEFELDNKCNLECQMCNGEVSSSIRRNRDKLPALTSPYDDNFVKQLEPYIPTLQEAKFYGGEPFMIPTYYKIWEKIKELNPSLELFLITNGSHWNKNIERLVNELNFDIAISIDANDKATVEKIRKNVVYETLIQNIKNFSQVCRSKDKYLSLSFTIQKDNWMFLKDHIELCNSVDAYAYISYLENPKEFSILELTRKEIEDIRLSLDNYTPPQNSGKEKHNYRCYEDYKQYLDRYLQNTEEMRYQDYKFIPDWAKPEDKEVFEIENFIKVRNDSSKEVFINECSKYLEENPKLNNYDLNALIEKVDVAIAGFNPDQQKKIYGMMIKSDFVKTLDDLNKSTNEELIELAKEILPKVVIDQE